MNASAPMARTRRPRLVPNRSTLTPPMRAKSSAVAAIAGRAGWSPAGKRKNPGPDAPAPDTDNAHIGTQPLAGPCCSPARTLLRDAARQSASMSRRRPRRAPEDMAITSQRRVPSAAPFKNRLGFDSLMVSDLSCMCILTLDSTSGVTLILGGMCSYPIATAARRPARLSSRSLWRLCMEVTIGLDTSRLHSGALQ